MIEGSCVLEIEGRLIIIDYTYELPVRGNRSGHPDTWEEDDGGFMEYGVSDTNRHTKKLIKLVNKHDEKVLDMLWSRI